MACTIATLLTIFVLVLAISLIRSGFPDIINVFSANESGYFCIKIPYLLSTLNGTLLSFAEGRRFSCSDYTWTDLVMKRSTDFGLTWSTLKVISSGGVCVFCAGVIVSLI